MTTRSKLKAHAAQSGELSRFWEGFKVFWRWFMFPVLTGTGPVLVAVSKQNTTIGGWLANPWVLWPCVLAAPLLFWAKKFWDHSEKKRITAIEAMRVVLDHLFTAVGTIVATKRNRLARLVKSFDSAQPPALRELIDGFMDPSDQIKTTCMALHGFFEKLSRENEDWHKLGPAFKVTMARVQDGKLVEWLHHWPEDQEPTAIEVLQHPRSGFSCLLASADEILIIEDIAAEQKKPQNRRRFHVPPERADLETGSVILFAVKDARLKGTCVVVAIRCSVPKVFEEKAAQREHYRQVLHCIANRLFIEHCSARVKERMLSLTDELLAENRRLKAENDTLKANSGNKP